MNTESVQALYYNREKLLKPPMRLYRTDDANYRHYWGLDENNNMFKDPSVTTILDKIMPQSEFLIKWIADFGIQRANEEKCKRADYGTLMHIICSQFLLNGKFSIDAIPMLIENFKYRNHIRYDTYFWQQDLERDILAFDVFAREYQLNPVAIEIPLRSAKYGFSGTIDIVAEITIGTGANGKILKKDVEYNKDGSIKKDLRRTIRCIIDMKSGRKGFHPNHAAQLHMYKPMWEENFPHFTIDAIYNWAPTAWESEPDYDLQDQTNSREATIWPLYLEIYKRKFDTSHRKYAWISGELELGKDNENLVFETFRERIFRINPGMQQQPEEDEGINVAPPVEVPAKKKAKGNISAISDTAFTEKIAETIELKTVGGDIINFNKETGEVIAPDLQAETPVKIIIGTPIPNPNIFPGKDIAFEELDNLFNNISGKAI